MSLRGIVGKKEVVAQGEERLESWRCKGRESERSERSERRAEGVQILYRWHGRGQGMHQLPARLRAAKCGQKWRDQSEGEGPIEIS